VPQILAGSAGNLVGVFVMTKAEERSPSQLLSRLSMARLILPTHARFALVLPKDTRLRQDIFDHFDGVIQDSELRSLPQFAKSHASKPSVRRDLAAVQAQAHRRYNVFLRAGRRHWAERSIPETTPAARRELLRGIEHLAETSVRRAPGGFFEYDIKHAIVVASPRPTRQAVQRNMAALTLDTIKQSYALDVGVPYWIRKTPYVLLIDHWPVGRFDPEKPARAAAFAGIALAAMESADELFRFSDRLALLTDRISLER